MASSTVNGSSLAVRLLGASIPPEIRRPLASIGSNFAALAAFAAYFGPWVVGELHASASYAAAAYLVAGLAGIAGGLLGGRLTDRFGPRPVALTASGMQVLVVAVLLIPGVTVVGASGVLVVLTFLQPVRGVAQRMALTADVPPDRREERFAAYRLVVNVGSMIGPAAGAAFVAFGWWQLHGSLVALYALSCLLARGLPAALPTTHSPVPLVASGARWWGDWRLYALLVATTAAWTVVYAYETLLPISLTQTYGLAPAVWGLLYAVGPAVVILLQLRMTRWTSGLTQTRRLMLGTLIMASSFQVLHAGHGVGVVLLIVLLFVLGDLLWGPASEDAPLRLAPAGRQATVMGLLTSSVWLGSAIAPAVGLPVRAHYGDGTMWIVITAVGVASAAIYVVVGRFSGAPTASADIDA